jgi:hypothetical protein
MDQFTMSNYSATFHEQGALIERKRPGSTSRITTATATKAVDFMRYHRPLCFTMMNNRPEELKRYTFLDHAKGGHR